MKYENSFEGVYPLMAKWWDYDLNSLKPDEVKYNKDYYAWFICPKCKKYKFRRNIKFISTLPFTHHICDKDKENLIRLKEDMMNKEQECKSRERLLKAEQKLYSKYGNDWKIISFTKSNEPCTLQHYCGEVKTITRFNSAIKNNLKCKCEKHLTTE